jgi:hypothetical protein
LENNKSVRKARNGVAYAQKQLAAARQKAAGQVAGGQVSKRKLAQRNITDPASRVMRTRSGYQQAYNAQLAVADDHLILVAEVTDQGADALQLIPIMTAVEEMTARCAQLTGRTDVRVGTITADSGYLSEENVAAPGPDRLIAPGRGRIHDGQWVSKQENPRATSQAAAVMLAKMADPANQALYRRRSVTVEPVNGHLKDRRGLRQFARRGLDAVDAELKLAAMTTNLMKLFTTTWRPAQTAT